MSAAAKLADRNAAPKGAPVLAFVSDEETLEIVSRVVPGGRRGVEVRDGGIATAISALHEATPPSLLIVDISDSGNPAGDVAALSDQCGHATTILALGPQNDVSLYRALVGAGVTDYLVKPVTSQDLRRAILTASKTETEAEQAANGKTSVIIGSRGGVGASSVSVGVAWLLSHDHKKQVALIDLDLHFGTAALSLDIEPGSGLRNALENPDRIDSLFVASALVNCSEHLYVMGGEEPLDKSFQLRSDSLERLMGELKRIFDVIVVDMPRHMIAASAQMLANAGSIALVTDLSLAGLRDALRIKTCLGRIAPDTTLRIVANRVGHAKMGEISQTEFERSLGAKIDFLMNEDAKAGKAALDGKPIAAAGRGRTGESMRLLARSLAGIDKAQVAGRRWFSFKAPAKPAKKK